MEFKKSKNKLFGVKLTKAEQRVLDEEIRKQAAEFDRKHGQEIVAMVLWELHDIFGFGEKRLRRFYDQFSPHLDELIERYELDSSDDAWICKKKLKDELQIDLDIWDAESGVNEIVEADIRTKEEQ